MIEEINSTTNAEDANRIYQESKNRDLVKQEEGTVVFPESNSQRQDVDSCHVCGKKEWRDRAGYGFSVRECQRCEQPVCEDHADCDASWGGEEDGYRLTQWVCSDKSKCLNDIDHDEVARIAAEIRALKNPTHADYERIIFPERFQLAAAVKGVEK